MTDSIYLQWDCYGAKADRVAQAEIEAGRITKVTYEPVPVMRIGH